MGLGQPQVGVVPLLDVGAVGDDVAARLRPLRRRALEQLHRPRALAPRQGVDAVAVGLVPFLGKGEGGHQCEQDRHEG